MFLLLSHVIPQDNIDQNCDKFLNPVAITSLTNFTTMGFGGTTRRKQEFLHVSLFQVQRAPISGSMLQLYLSVFP